MVTSVHLTTLFIIFSFVVFFLTNIKSQIAYSNSFAVKAKENEIGPNAKTQQSIVIVLALPREYSPKFDTGFCSWTTLMLKCSAGKNKRNGIGVIELVIYE
ncbi:hypothetical protein CWB89_06605 [Pseudoalteromonas piscicida]|uniref:Transmembrane protein n=1 Tax=Pseudoalteromonas piscicida TaxID=43662 RepID=A0AAQ2IS48_PSEO7|nr:hypothetical protein CWB95_06850 [Pseudoalteromonas piscicida]TMN84313.1 hypothetical protein CWB87_05215 [Pseudoalteromonas flavipulchra]TMN44215.1 hypothetical protein CWB94_01270 [Pseudoalteromonas piscicida]TMN56895.1 hypothetical protein CWB92_01935 [Pseudoalteromonas piscicida]TMN57590.1 hypothetical protein CWB91_03230 [Pseudoalteromonas piscicida]